MSALSARKANLKRLLRPRHIAFIGGNDAAFSAKQCADQFKGPVWGVNPNCQELGGQPCYPTVLDLPEAPDAVFLATPRKFTTNIISQLNDMGAGGVVCFTAGYAELGEQGRHAEKELITAAGNLALVGPNCYGLISFAHDAILWPFGAGKQHQTHGVALIMQSGMIAANLIMNQRSVPFSYVISAGNQAVLAMEDYIDVLAEDPAVSAIGLYVEGIINIESFANASIKALKANKPIVILKSGSSTIGAELAVSHTGSLSGTDEAYNALFDEIGVLRVESPEAMLETLKFITVSGLPKGNRLFAFTCSGGDAALVADYCEKRGIELPQPTADQATMLCELLPDIATVSNPLDYTTPLWGNAQILPNVFRTAMKDQCDMGIFIQDYPPKAIHPDNSAYVTDGLSFMSVSRELMIPSGICSDISENIDPESRQRMVDRGVTPLQGVDRGLDALANAWWLNRKRNQLLARYGKEKLFCLARAYSNPPLNETYVLNEWRSKEMLKRSAIPIPSSVLIADRETRETINAIRDLRFPLVVKAVSALLPHKTEVGAVKLNLQNQQAVIQSMEDIQSSISGSNPSLTVDGYLVEEMISDVIAELVVGIRYDHQFGLVLVIGSGGILVELIKDTQTLLLPTTTRRIQSALEKLMIFPLLKGYRGKPGVNKQKVVETILHVTELAVSQAGSIVELEINPLIITTDSVYAADALIRSRAEETV